MLKQPGYCTVGTSLEDSVAAPTASCCLEHSVTEREADVPPSQAYEVTRNQSFGI